MPEPATRTAEQQVRWAKLIDHDRCIGCHACTTACKSENEVPLSVTRTYVKYVDVGVFPHSRRAFQVTRCNQCERAPCATACPTGAMFRRGDGIVDFDKSVCIGCKACIAACPYDAIFINPEDHSAENCNFCAHRLDVDLEPACVVVCPVEALLIGDLNEPGSKVARTATRHPVSVRRPEKETHPKLFYKGAHQATLDPIAAARPAGGAFMWSEQQAGPGLVVSGHPGEHSRAGGNGGTRANARGGIEPGNSSAAAILAYDVVHRAPWDWRVSLYTLTKGVAAGAYLAAALLLMTGVLGANGPLWEWAAPAVATVFLGITGGLLLWDLEHPARFYMIFTRPQWKSWLVRGAFIIAGFGAVLALHLLAALAGWSGLPRPLLLLGIPLGALTAVYTAYLFAQAKGRDLWQNPLLPPHFLVQALLAGSAALVPVAAALEPVAVPGLLWLLSGASFVHLLMVAGETTVTHGTAHAHLASRELTMGRYGAYFWIGTLLVAMALAAPWIGPVAGAIALVGLLAFEHAYVQAGQAVPLA
jgi:Fe-S-cluster-containing dehydrogenase component/formate-dependent nitrite reductase membrane component NrfD